MTPSFYWKKLGGWKFYCEVSFEQIEEQDPVAFKEIEAFFSNKGIARAHWKSHTHCCGAKFIPWARGCSKVLEIYTESDGWLALLAERLPEELDDEIKGVIYEWNKACSKVTAEEILAAMPTIYPLTGQPVGGGIPGFRRFDFDKLQEVGCLILMRVGWMTLCQMIARRDAVNLSRIITLCDQFAISQEANPSLAESMAYAAGGSSAARAVAKARSGPIATNWSAP